MSDIDTLVDADEAARVRARRVESVAQWVLPVAVLAIGIWFWDRIVVWNDIPHYILPGPGLVVETLQKDWEPVLRDSLLVTAQITLMALAVAVVGGVGLAVLFNQSRWAEMSFYPYAVILQVTPVVSIAPLIFIYVDNRLVGLLLCAWIVAFFPILANTTLGLKSADTNLRDLMTIYRATRWQRQRYLQLPSAQTYFQGGLRIAGGLSLIGAVLTDYVEGTGGIGSG
ncbi:MAG: ABC transporter permease, partial [Gemmobacter sp.]